jgi:hypothetical protein
MIEDQLGAISQSQVQDRNGCEPSLRDNPGGRC